MRLLGIFVCLVALGLTGFSALTYKAPKIEADIERRTAEVLSAMAVDDVTVVVDGRHIMLKGNADAEQRQEILRAVAAVPGALGPVDNLEQSASTPFRFLASKDEAGTVVIEGQAPDQTTKATIEADARALFGPEAAVEIEIVQGTAPEGWLIATASALDALATLYSGGFSLTGTELTLEGDVMKEADVELIDIFAEAVPANYAWQQDVGIRRQSVEPYTFSVVKAPDGALLLEGYAPDEETRAALIEASETVAGGNSVVADIQIADGMPDEEWPFLVQSGISAMQDMDAGRFDVSGVDVSFSSDPGSSADGIETDRATAEGVETESAAADDAEPQTLAETDNAAPAPSDSSLDAALTPGTDAPDQPASTLTIDKVEPGLWSIRGVVPDQGAEDILVAALSEHAGGEEVEVELDVAGGNPDADWVRYATDHLRALDEVAAGRLSLEAYEAHLIGVVDAPENIEPIRSVLAAISQDMTVDLQPIDPRPVASLDLTISEDDGIVLSGDLPGDLSEGEALLTLGIQRYDGELRENARGSADAWRESLSEIGAVLPAFDTLDLTFGDERPEIRGLVHIHADADNIARRLVLALGDDQQPLVDVSTTTAILEDGITRTSPLTGEAEVHRRGYWLPVIEIAADRQACSDYASVILNSSKITFLRGEETLDTRAEPALNALASLALVCLDSTDLVLEIGGHTDSRGATALNQELSQARADAVLNALVARGIDADAMIAVGYGDTQPIANNATDEGRAANRRTTIEWRTSAEARSISGEG